jgi:hypothetical protein
LGIGAAYGGTIAVFARSNPSRTDALNPGYFMRMLHVGSTENVSFIRPSGAQQPLIVHAGYDVSKLSVVILLLDRWIKGLEAGGQNDSPYLYFFFLRRLVQIYCVILAHSFANPTFLFFEVKTAFINVCNEWNGLSEVYMDCFIHRYFLIILVRIFRWAIFYTGSATRTFILKNIPWLFSQGYLEVFRIPFYTVNFSVGEDLYIWMPADLDQLW